MERLTIVKTGGKVIDDPVACGVFLKSFAAIEGAKILVHGGGNIATEIGRRLGLQPRYVDGRRVTDAETLELVTMVYGGLVNKQLVARLQAVGCNAIGLTGADGNVIQAAKRPVGSIDYGFVGDVLQDGVNAMLLRILLAQNLTPVLAPLTHDGNGNMLNTNADTIAQEIAKAMASMFNVQLVYCFEKAGVLRDAADESSVISTINPGYFAELKERQIVSGGMIPKLDNAFAAIVAGVDHVIIGKAEDLSALISGTAGTRISAAL